MNRELEELKKVNPELRARIDHDRKRYGERFLRAYNREVIKKANEQAQKQKEEIEHPLDEEKIIKEARPFIKRSRYFI